jgi:hypothetical protein
MSTRRPHKAFDGENFYWPGSSGSTGSTGIVAKVAKSGGAVTTIFSVEDTQVIGGVGVDDTSVYVLYGLSGVTTSTDPNTMGALVKITPK